ncbi:hypothetical protein U717_04220 [Rhodobacter capsulatus R121]|nr:hypothetical protein U714_04215 [Rhodobacter capsulatus DE442]ETD79050.1 hypothetical protein U717_04220 [Rhodobacter capsulatus R121]ETE54965.1 hypothetical protein U715_04210 [Rhodobacter capsulatus Y262]
MVQALRFPSEMIERAERACVRWIGEEFGRGQAAAAHDHWIKRGHVVVEVIVNRRDTESGDAFLCVVDPESGDLFKPSVFETHTWR